MYRRNLELAYAAAASTPGAANPLVTATEQPWIDNAGTVELKAGSGANGCKIGTAAVTYTVDGDATTGDWDSADANVAYAAGAWANKLEAGADVTEPTNTITVVQGVFSWGGTIGSAIDNNVNTYIVMSSQPIIFNIDTVDSHLVNGIRINSGGGDVSYYPNSITIRGSANGVAWSTIATVVTTDMTVASTWYEYSFTNAVSYQYYQIELNSSPATIGAIRELELVLIAPYSVNNILTSNNLLSGATSIAPPTFVAKDESGAAIVGDGKFLIAYSINGGAMSAQIEQSVFKALPASTFDAITSLVFQIELVGYQKMSSISITTISSGILQAKTGSITLSISDVDVYKVESDGDVIAADMYADDITMTGNLVMDNTKFISSAVSTISGDTATDIALITMGTDETIAVTMDVVAKVPTSTEHAVYKLHAIFYKNGTGDVTQIGETMAINAFETNPAWDADMVVNGTTGIKCQVTGVADKTINWYANIQYHKV